MGTEKQTNFERLCANIEEMATALVYRDDAGWCISTTSDVCEHFSEAVSAALKWLKESK